MSTVNKARSTTSGNKGFVIPVVVVAVIAVAALVAFIAVGVDEDNDPTEFDTATASVAGAPLSPLPDQGADMEVGAEAPPVEGVDLEGDAVRIPEEGRPAVVLFLAHWCPHCQAEVPEVTDWLEEGNGPDDVDIVAVSTGHDPDQPNYPASAWLDGEDWPAPVVADASGAVAQSYGLSRYPFWAVIDGDGNLVGRLTGRLSTDELDQLVDAARQGAPVEAPEQGEASDA